MAMSLLLRLPPSQACALEEFEGAQMAMRFVYMCNSEKGNHNTTNGFCRLFQPAPSRAQGRKKATVSFYRIHHHRHVAMRRVAKCQSSTSRSVGTGI